MSTGSMLFRWTFLFSTQLFQIFTCLIFAFILTLSQTQRLRMANALKLELIDKLKQENCFWSFNNDTIEISDEILIEKTLLHLDLPEIDKLF